MAAPRKHPPNGAAETIKQLAASGHSLLGIASKLGVAISTFKRWLEEDEMLQDAFDLGRETERQELHAMVVQSAREGKPPNVNAFFLLKARHGYVEADQKSGNRVSVAVEAQNVMVVVNHGSDEEWEAKAKAQQAKLMQEATHTPPALPVPVPDYAPTRPATSYVDVPPAWQPPAAHLKPN